MQYVLKLLTRHKELTKVDKYRYDEAWERDYAAVLQNFFQVKDPFSLICSIRSSKNLSLQDILIPKADVSVIDLRQPSDFAINNLPGSWNLPIALATDVSPFSSPAVMTAVWTQLENTFSNPDEDLLRLVQNKRILLICYDGDSARVATSVLRAKGYVADSVRDGFANFAPLNLREDRDAEVSTWLKKTHNVKLGSTEFRVPEAGLPPTPPSLSSEEGL
jgi:rhodanese-related sulfurtransferase